jgi:hypothetical protein
MRERHVLLLSCAFLFVGSLGQLDYFEGAGVDASEENSVYLLMVVFFAINFATPVLAWVNRTYVGAILDKANERLSEIQQRISERISDAGRKLSDRMRN